MKITVEKITNWVVVLALAGYPVVSFIPAILSIPSTPISLTYRALYLLFSIIVIFWAFVKVGFKIRLNIGILLFVGFWIIYSIRLVYDISIKNIPLYEGHKAFYFYSLAFGGALVPSIAIFMGIKYVNYQWITRNALRLFTIFGTFLVALLVLKVNIPHFHNGRLIANEALNSISTGHAGSSLAILALCEIIFPTKYRKYKTVLLISFVMGTGITLYAGARSPLIVLIIVTFILVLRFVFSRKLNIRTVYFLVFIVITGFFGIMYYIFPQISKGEYKVVERLSNTGGNQEVRKVVWKTALLQFKENPIIGDQFLERSHGKYPHNILLEVPMATGIVGMLPFVLVMIILWFKAIYLVIKWRTFIPIFALLVQFFLGSLTSGAIFGSGGLWILIALTLATSIKKPNNINVNYKSI